MSIATPEFKYFLERLDKLIIKWLVQTSHVYDAIRDASKGGNPHCILVDICTLVDSGL
ncbi:hypothetical protein PGT21_012366 [Puccinia graminis f. sp. tritici]|uniref:Uncharacterized protein n=1 Tax=Puccinia graminis f. sp. tritici TaxID=56615 RepID=A0A5B0PSG8_PUCGR|nr:hypothetical protein PGT21_012366 [Puccinia graminis f. sp. tritici]KAA1103623.1 hypothetical protein PGTUg99_002187 [Puccinia graminis f. sp. tritici]